jgi:protein SCO1/2
MNSNTILTLLSTLTLACLVSAVLFGRHFQHTRDHSPDARRFEVHGTVRSIDIAEKTIRIAHEEIPGYMPAMTMPLPVKDVTLLRQVAAGDQVRFELSVTTNDSWIAHIEKLPSEAPSGVSITTSGSAAEPDTESLRPGELVPDFSLTNQEEKTIRLHDFRGQAVLLTFIYTRCPLPNFCPLMTKNFAELQQRLSKEFPGKYHLLSVSIDPDFDRPEVLKEYAARCEADPKNWTFATGEADSIRFVAGLMGLYYARENGLISHDLRTALIGPDGKLVHVWKSNVWTPYEVQRRVRETLTGSADVAVR